MEAVSMIDTAFSIQQGCADILQSGLTVVWGGVIIGVGARLAE
jgi:hypothetical protein